MRERLCYWWRVLRMGAGQFNVVAGWAGTIILAVGAIAGFAVTVQFHLSHWLIAVIVLGLLVCVTAEGGYRVWHKSEKERRDAEAERDAARRDRSCRRSKSTGGPDCRAGRPGNYLGGGQPKFADERID